MSIKFDDIHTKKKQLLLDEMMHKITNEIHQIDSGKKKNKSKSCPICEHPNIVFFTKKYGFDIDKCNTCGLLFCNPYPSDKQVHYYYNSAMKRFENEFFMESFENRVQIFLPRIGIINKYKTEGSLLDIGSSVGIFIEALKRTKHNLNVTCCDISEDACLKLKNKHPEVTIINLDYKQIGYSEKYDIITMWDTVEHIIDLHELFHSITNLLNDEGLFLFSTPNTNSFEWITAGINHVQLLPPGHVNLLNITNIEILLEQHDLDLLDTFTLNPSLDIDYTLKSPNQKNDLGIFLHKMLMDSSFRSSFETLLKDQKLAGNIVVVAQRKNTR